MLRDAATRYAFIGFALVFSLIVGLSLLAPQHYPQAPFAPQTILDKPVPDFRLPTILPDGSTAVNPASVLGWKGHQTVVLYFLSTQCGMCRITNPRVAKLQQNHPDLMLAGVRCNKPDTPAELAQWAQQNHFPILNDEHGAVSTYFQVSHTPTFAVLDKTGVLRYLGSFDDNWDEKNATHHYVEEAVVSLESGQTVVVKFHAATGCAITPLK